MKSNKARTAGSQPELPSLLFYMRLRPVFTNKSLIDLGSRRLHFFGAYFQNTVAYLGLLVVGTHRTKYMTTLSLFSV